VNDVYDHDAILRLISQFDSLDPNAIAERIKQHAAAALKAQKEWGVSRDARQLEASRRESAMERAAQLRLATDFGAARGWRLSDAAFGLRTLGEGKQHAGGMRCSMFSRHSNPGAGEFHDNFDHPYYHRRNRKAAAIAAHLYNYPANRAACEKIADHYGLQFEVPDFPSWCYPNGTKLVVYIGPEGRQRS
jgi:hypothetical protein